MSDLNFSFQLEDELNFAFQLEDDLNFSFKMGDVTIVSGASDMTADFSVSKTSNVLINEILTFTDLSDQSPTHWSWRFGDGNTSTDQNPTHSYSTSGNKTVGLLAGRSDQVGDFVEKTDHINVLSDPTLNNGTLLIHYKQDYTLDGSNISKINDETANNHDAVQATSAAQPVKRASDVNGYDAARFDGTDDFMDTETELIAETEDVDAFATFWMVNILDGKPASNEYLMGSQSSNNNARRNLFIVSPEGHFRTLIKDTSTQIITSVDNHFSNGEVGYQAYCTLFDFKNGVVRMWAGETELSPTGTDISGVNQNDIANGTLYLGALHKVGSGDLLNANVDIAEFFMMNWDGLTDAQMESDISDNLAYLTGKYGI